MYAKLDFSASFPDNLTINITHWSIIYQKEGIKDIPDNWPKFKKISEIYLARKGICNHIS